MIAGSILNLLLNGLNGLAGDSKPSLPEKVSEDFDSLIKKSIDGIRNMNCAENARLIKTDNPEGSGTGAYLEALNKGLIARGKSLDKACLNSNDIHILADFLRQCGYTEADAEKFIGKLLEKHPDGMIPLSEFFSQVTAPGTSGGRPYPSIIINPSVAPRFDSLLKDFGLTLEEAGRTLNVARAADGGLDLDKLIAQLKVAGDRMKGEKRGTVEAGSSVKVSKKLEELGIQIQPAPATGQIAMNDLITGLEHLRDRAIVGLRGTGTDTTGREYDGRSTGKIIQTAQENSAEGKNNAGQLPLNVKSSIDRIIERSVAANEKLELQLAVPSILQFKSASSGGVKEITGTGYFSEGNRRAAQASKNGKPSIKQNNYGGRIVEAGLQEKSDRISDLNEGSRYKKEMNLETDRGGLKTKAAEILQDGGYPSIRYETLSSIPRNRQTDSNFFPEHIVDQLGKQISRSVLRGDRIINLQLNPPDLGAVKLSMEIKGNTLQLGMIAESSSVKEIMLAGAHELRSALLEQGIRLESLDIQVGQNFGRSLTNLNEGSGQEHQQYHETNGDLFSDNDVQEDVLPSPRNMAGRYYLLDLEA
jgi:hypothetical protein